MTKQLLPHDVTPEDRARGALWCSTFRRPGDEVEKLGTINGAPTINRGVTLDGTNDWIAYALWGQFNSADPFSFHLLLSDAGFAWDEGGYARTFFDDNVGAQYKMAKNAADDLQLWVGGTSIGTVAAATMDALWNQNGRNLISFACTTGANLVWCNGTEVLNNNTAWTPVTIASFDLGQRFNNSQRWPGTVEMLKFYGTYLQTAEDHAAIWAGGGA